MNIIVGINHPKQVYMFKNLVYALKEKGHDILVLLVDKEISSNLLESFNISFVKIGTNKKQSLKKIISLLPLTAKTTKKCFGFKPDLFIGQAIAHLAFASFFFNKPYVIFEDTENAKYPHLLSNPFANHIITPAFFEKDFGNKQITIKGSFEHAYLSKRWFVPQKSVLKKYGLSEGETYSIVRFVSWGATHDLGHKGLTIESKVKAVKEFEKFGRVILSSEAPLPEELEAHKINIDPADMHSLLAYAKLVYGESATMAAEAGYLGTPSVYLDNDGRGYTNYLENYKLVHNFSESPTDQMKSISKGVEILSSKNKEYWIKQAEVLSSECIDVGEFMIWFVENYPQSAKIIKQNPDYQFNFVSK